jgi:hypothetical protein
VPLYTSIWYSARAIHAVRRHSPDPAGLTFTLVGTLPFWAVSALWSYLHYLSLPDHVQDCFIVTAASRGHRKIVGPHFNVLHRGQARSANQQLATLWAFEALWQKHAPCTHSAFRRIYNVIGPIMAKQIRSAWTADLVFIALKPAQFFACSALAIEAFRNVKKRPSPQPLQIVPGTRFS